MADFKINQEGIRELLTSSKMVPVIEQATAQVCQRAGGDHKYDIQTGGHRVVGMVKTGSQKDYYSNIKHNTLLNALGGK